MSDGYLEYPHRRPGLDHDRFDVVAAAGAAARRLARRTRRSRCGSWWRSSPSAPRPRRPRSGRAGRPTRQWFDFREWTQRDYGPRVGLPRLFEVLDDHGIVASAAVNADVHLRTPPVLEQIMAHGWEIIAHGVSASLPLHEGMSIDEERAVIAESLETLRGATGAPVRGWLGRA